MFKKTVQKKKVQIDMFIKTAKTKVQKNSKKKV